MASAAVLVLFFSYTYQPQICVQSSYIDKVVYQKKEIFNCAKGVRINWDPDLDKEIKSLNGQLNRIESLIKIKSQQPLRLEILEQNDIYYFSGNYLFISKNKLQSSQALELHLIKKWVQHFNLEIRQNKILEDLLVSFKYYLLFGKLPKMEMTKEFNVSVNWKPIQNSSNYTCVTNWKLTPTWNLCINNFYQFFDTNFDFYYDRLYTKVLHSWVESLRGMSLIEQYELHRNLKNYIALFKAPVKYPKESVNSFSYNLKTISHFWMPYKSIPRIGSGKKFLVGFLRGINNYNFSAFVENSKFDLVYFKQNLNWNTVYENKNIHLLMKKYPHLKIAISNFKEIMVLPIEKKFRVNVFSGIKADQIVLETCSSLALKDIIKYEKITDKLISTYDCNFNQLKKIDQLIARGASGFALQNSDTQFVQFHLPSLLQKRDLLNENAEIFQFVQTRNVKNSVYEVFGWKELNWDQITKSYKPKAYVEAVGYFRTRYSF